MHSFKDALGREWTVPQITVGHLRKLRDAGKGDFGGIDVQATIAKTLNDPVLITDALFLICDVQAKGLTVDQFDAGLFGDAVKRARAAFWEGLHDFFWQEIRTYMRALIDKLDESEASILASGAFGTVSTESQPNLESTPTPTATAS